MAGLIVAAMLAARYQVALPKRVRYVSRNDAVVIERLGPALSRSRPTRK